MSSRRVLKAAEAIREVVSMTILTEIKDPRVEHVTVTFVEVSPDMRMAKVHVSIMGSEAKQNLALHGLRSAAGFLQAKVSKRIDTRYTPKIQFVLDQGVKRSIEISRVLKELLPADENTGVSTAEDSENVSSELAVDDENVGADVNVSGEKKAGDGAADSLDE